MMMAKLAWKNIWRNKTRSLVVIIATSLGLWAGIFASAFVKGMMEQKINNVIEKELSHFQIHDPGFKDEYLPEFLIRNDTEILNDLENRPEVKGVASRVIAMGMISSPKNAGSIRVNGIIPGEEKVVTSLDSRVAEGSYFGEDRKNQILISQKTADHLKVRLKSKVVITVQDMNREIAAGAFRVTGIYASDNPLFDEMNVYVQQKDLRSLLGVTEGTHEIAVLLREHDLAEPMAEEYRKKYPNLLVEPWLDLSSGMRYMVEAFDSYVYFIVGIILLALILSIINTMLMAILERTREIGMLMAIGMNKVRLFALILTETVFLSLIGGPVGLLISWLTIRYFSIRGINLVGAAYGEMGFGNVVYPFLEFESYIGVTIMVMVMAVLAAAGVRYEEWFAVAFRMWALLMGIGAVAVIVAVATGLS